MTATAEKGVIFVRDVPDLHEDTRPPRRDMTPGMRLLEVVLDADQVQQFGDLAGLPKGKQDGRRVVIVSVDVDSDKITLGPVPRPGTLPALPSSPLLIPYDQFPTEGLRATISVQPTPSDPKEAVSGRLIPRTDANARHGFPGQRGN